MPLPETIPVRYTEEEAAYLSVRPVVRQSFRLYELIDMVLGVAGKDPARIQQILRSGTCVYHFYRYWWPGFEADSGELAAVLAQFPDDDPRRPFRAEECVAVLLESGGQPARYSFEVDRASASRKPWFRFGSFWESLMSLGTSSAPIYRGYSYARRADLFEAALSPGQLVGLIADALRLASRGLRAQLGSLRDARRVVFICPRTAG